jgi:hypothetical protein
VRNFATALGNASPYLIFGYAKTLPRRRVPSRFSEPPKNDDDQPSGTLREGAGPRSAGSVRSYPYTSGHAQVADCGCLRLVPAGAGIRSSGCCHGSSTIPTGRSTEGDLLPT